MSKMITRPPVMSPVWCAGVDHAVGATVIVARRNSSEATTAADRILKAANLAGNQTAQKGLKHTWTAESALRVWGRACDDLQVLVAPLPQGRLRMYPLAELRTLSSLPMRFLESAARLYAEVAPAVAAGAKVGDRSDAIAMLKVQEFLLNYVITPAVIDEHEALDSAVLDTHASENRRVSHDAHLSIVTQISGFAATLCRLAGEYAPDSNPYAALVADEFFTGYAKVNSVLHF